MALYLSILVILMYVVWRSGQTIDGGWRFARMRATAMLLGAGFRIFAVFVFAVVLGVLTGTVRSTF